MNVRAHGFQSLEFRVQSFKFLCVTSVFSVSTMSGSLIKVHHRDTEDTEDAQRLLLIASRSLGGKHFSRLVDECADAHAVERAPNEEDRNQEEAQRQDMRQGCVPVISGRQANSEFYRQ